MAVSAAIAAALAAKYPTLAAEAAGAEELRLVEQMHTVRGVTKVLARFRKYRIGNQVVALDEPLEAKAVPVAAPVATVVTENVVAQLAEKASEASTSTEPPAPAVVTTTAPVAAAHSHDTHTGKSHRK